MSQPAGLKLISWNVNGIRAAQKHGFLKWFANQNADIVCVQEIKAMPEQLDEELKHPEGYHSSFFPAKKPGYSGTAIFTKEEPLSFQLGIPDSPDFEKFNNEGRTLIAHYKDFTLINAYFPNSQPDHARLPFKLEFCAGILSYCEILRKQGKSVILCGDYNIAHKEIDLKNPKSNVDNAGFLPEERA